MIVVEKALNQHTQKKRSPVTGRRKLSPAKMTPEYGLSQPTDKAPSLLKNNSKSNKREWATTAGIKRPRPEKQQHRPGPLGSPASDSAGDPTVVKSSSSHRYGTRPTTAGTTQFESPKPHTTLKRNLDSVSQGQTPPSAPASAPAPGPAQPQIPRGKRRTPTRVEPNCNFIFVDGRRRRSTPNLVSVDANRTVHDSAAHALKLPLSVVDARAFPATAAPAVAPSATVTMDVFPPGGGGDGGFGDRRRARSRLSLGRHRRGDDTVSSGRGKPDSATHGYPWGPSFQQQQGMISG